MQPHFSSIAKWAAMTYGTGIMEAFTSFALIGNIGMTEIIVVLLILLLLFGGRKLPELARGMGKSMKEFRKAASEVEDDFKQAMDATDPAKNPPPTQNSDASSTKTDAKA